MALYNGLHRWFDSTLLQFTQVMLYVYKLQVKNHYLDADVFVRDGFGDQHNNNRRTVVLRYACLLFVFRRSVYPIASAAAGAVEDEEKENDDNNPNEGVVVEEVT